MSPRYGFLKILIDKRKKVIINPETRLSEENFTLRQSCDLKKTHCEQKKVKPSKTVTTAFHRSFHNNKTLTIKGRFLALLCTYYCN